LFEIEYEKVGIQRFCTNMIKSLVLGTAKWGSLVDKTIAFQILDKFVDSGGRLIDSATNYPINGVRKDFGLANKFLVDWITQNPGVDLNVFVKLGAIDNLGGPNNDLSGKSLHRSVEMLQQSFEQSLGGLGVHWDNRGIDDSDEISETLQQFNQLHQTGYRIGFSGVRIAETYMRLAPNLRNSWEIQVKETVGSHTVRDGYLPFFPKASYFVYGISGNNALPKDDVNDIQTHESSKADLYFFSIREILENHEVEKVIIGPRTTEQIESLVYRCSGYL